MNELMNTGLMVLCVGAVLCVIGFIGYGIDYYVTKKIAGLPSPYITLNVVNEQVDDRIKGEMSIAYPHGTWKFTPSEKKGV